MWAIIQLTRFVNGHSLAAYSLWREQRRAWWGDLFTRFVGIGDLRNEPLKKAFAFWKCTLIHTHQVCIRRFDSRAIFLRQCHFQNVLLSPRKQVWNSGNFSSDGVPLCWQKHNCPHFEKEDNIYLFIYLFIIFIQGSPFTDRWYSMGTWFNMFL